MSDSSQTPWAGACEALLSMAVLQARILEWVAISFCIVLLKGVNKVWLSGWFSLLVTIDDSYLPRFIKSAGVFVCLTWCLLLSALLVWSNFVFLFLILHSCSTLSFVCFRFFIYVLFYVRQVAILGSFVYFLTLYTPWIIFFGLATTSTLISQSFQCRSLFEAPEPHTR